MSEEQLEKLLASYADKVSSVPVPQEIKNRLPEKVCSRVKSIQIISNFMATGIMIAGAAILIVGLLTFILRQKQELTSESVEKSTANRSGFISHSEAQRAEESPSEMLRFAQHDRAYKTASGQQTYIETLSDEEFVSLLMDRHEESLLPDVESKLFGLDLEVLDFVEMAG